MGGLRTRAAPEDQPVPPARWLCLLFGLVIILFGIIAYLPSFHGVFLLDDDRNIVNNLLIRHVVPIGEHLHTRRPITSLSLAICYELSKRLTGDGLDVRVYHAFNLGIHLLAALVLFGIIRRTLRLPQYHLSYARSAPWIAAAVALLWTVHPLLTQSVTYIIQRGESMMGLCYLLTLYFVLRGSQARHYLAWHIAAMLTCACGMGCKAVMVTAPIAVLVYDWCFLSKSFAEALRVRWVLYVGLAAGWAVLVFTGVARGVLTTGASGVATVGFSVREITPIQYLLTQSTVILHYLRLAIWPTPLCLDYGWTAVQDPLQILIPSVVILALLVAAIWGLIRRHALGFVAFIFFLILSPTSSFIPIRDVIFEHRMYLPLAALITFGVLLADRIYGRLFAKLGLGPSLGRPVAAVSVICAALLLAIGTSRRNTIYQSGITIWRDALETNPDNVRAHNHLAHHFWEGKNSRLAAEHWLLALQNDPNNYDALVNLGILYSDRGDYQKAMKNYRLAIALQPDLPKAHYNKGNTLRKMDLLDEATDAYREAQRADPTMLEAYVMAGNVLDKQNRPQAAIAEFRRGLIAAPVGCSPAMLARLHFNIGNEFLQMNNAAEALREYNSALMHRPRWASAQYGKAYCYKIMGQIDEAIEALQKTLEFQPDYAAAKHMLTEIGKKGAIAP